MAVREKVLMSSDLRTVFEKRIRQGGEDEKIRPDRDKAAAEMVDEIIQNALNSIPPGPSKEQVVLTREIAATLLKLLPVFCATEKGFPKTREALWKPLIAAWLEAESEIEECEILADILIPNSLAADESSTFRDVLQRGLDFYGEFHDRFKTFRKASRFLATSHTICTHDEAISIVGRWIGHRATNVQRGVIGSTLGGIPIDTNPQVLWEALPLIEQTTLQVIRMVEAVHDLANSFQSVGRPKLVEIPDLGSATFMWYATVDDENPETRVEMASRRFLENCAKDVLGWFAPRRGENGQPPFSIRLVVISPRPPKEPLSFEETVQ